MKTLASLAWFAGACALAFGQQDKTAAAAASGLAAADVAAIRAASKSYTELALARDWPKWIKLFADDAIYMPPHETAKHGLKEIEAWVNGLPVMKTLVVEPLEFTGGGGLAVVRGRYSFTMASQPDVPDTGKYIEVWRKQSDGAWKLFRDIWNSDLPLPVGATAASTARPAPASREFVSVDTTAVGWEDVKIRPPLVWQAKGLFQEPETGMQVALIRYPAGVTNPRHTHPHGHGMYVLEGTLVTSRGNFRPGSFVWFPEGEAMEHGATAERDVVVVFITNKKFGIDYVDTPIGSRRTSQ